MPHNLKNDAAIDIVELEVTDDAPEVYLQISRGHMLLGIEELVQIAKTLLPLLLGPEGKGRITVLHANGMGKDIQNDALEFEGVKA